MVVVVSSLPVASLLAVTVAPDTTPPPASVTVPLSVPVVAWAITGSLKMKTIIISDNENAAINASDFAIGEFFI